ncbi:hypothetical protein [Marinobacter qingdaonensis]|uniref:Peptidoglycan L-alanyl-D-glutamate endopeptidase CwlK n=1 Tax=Marinobacter qingdaonensis TaxID=3108486 RepID=A0ABU5NUP4_9GAMM|nr:hypothetical protein [Marinobacter sp. ASW11-75]MEA1079525.1 hypothetical protein [Marinobacter sp. ASW11-75]
MPSYSEKSAFRLSTCHPDLQKVFQRVIRVFDHSVLCGHRGKDEQNRFFRQGKSKVRWPNGKHNSVPSMAVDAAPWPIDWHDRERFSLFAGFVIGIAREMYDDGEIDHLIRWGGDWDCDTEVTDNGFDDLPHFELINP